MAVDLAQQQSNVNNFYKYYSSQQQPTPNSSGIVTPTNFSPTSPRASTNSTAITSPASSTTGSTNLAYQTRQLRPPKCPLYVPAVLRPTERPTTLASAGRPGSREHGLGLKDQPLTTVQDQIHAPLTPPSSAGNSYSGNEVATGEVQVADAYANQPPTPGFGGDQARKMVNGDIATTNITRLVTDEWNEAALEDVTGAPTRDHWKPDSSTSYCDYPSCSISFSLLNRRHHCRRCGQIFCAAHSAYIVPLDQHARFHRQGYRARACGSCSKDYNAWELMMGGKLGRPGSMRGSGSNSNSSGSTTPVTIHGSGARSSQQDDDAAGELGTTPSSASVSARNAKGAPGAPKKNAVEMLVGSITRDWNWSTF